jgi:hypothetical protein
MDLAVAGPESQATVQGSFRCGKIAPVQGLLAQAAMVPAPHITARQEDPEANQQHEGDDRQRTEGQPCRQI